MRIIIIGAGRVGFYLADMLSRENHDVVIIENSQETCKHAGELLDVMVINGSGSSPYILEQAGIKNCDMLIAVSAIDEVNIIACMIAQQFNVRIKIARVRNHEFMDSKSVLSPDRLGIDLMIHPEQETANEIVLLMKRASATDVLEFENGKVQVVGLRIDRHSPILNTSLQEISQKYPEEIYRTIAICRDNKTIIPTGRDVIRLRDQVFVIAESASMPHVLSIFGKGNEKMENVMILGGGKVGRLVAAELEKDRSANIKILEANRAKSEMLADQLKNTLVIHGDGTDLDLLAIEGITEMDGYISVTDDEESNIISCLLAKHLGVRRTIAEVNRSDYLPLMGSIGIDAAVDRRMITANTILRFIRRGRVKAVGILREVEAEVLEIEAGQNSKLVGKAIKNAKLPEGAIIGSIAKDDKIIIPIGDTIIRPLDRLIIFALPKALGAVEKLLA